MNIVAAIFAVFRKPSPATPGIAPGVIAPHKVTQPDPRIMAIKKAAAGRLATRTLDPELVVGMAEVRVEWLKTLTTAMLIMVNSATESQLREHLAGRRSIRGLLAADRDSVEAFKKAMRPPIWSGMGDDVRRGGGGGPKRNASVPTPVAAFGRR